jgi:hypothetical protein
MNKQEKLVAREEKILKRKQNKPGNLLEITRMRIMYAPVSRIFDEWSPCSKLRNEARVEYRLFSQNEGCSGMKLVQKPERFELVHSIDDLARERKREWILKKISGPKT